MNHSLQPIPSSEALSDICKLAQGTDRVLVALDVVMREQLSPSQVRLLREIIREYDRVRESSGIRPEPEDMTDAMLASLSVSAVGIVSFSIPAGVSLIDAITSLNATRCASYFQRVGDLVYPPDVDEILSRTPGALESSHTQPRHISLQLVVPGSIGKSREQQESLLAEERATFAHPCDVALAVCLVLRASVLKNPILPHLELAGKLIRTSDPTIAIAPEWSNGITVVSLSKDDQGSSHGYRQLVASAERTKL